MLGLARENEGVAARILLDFGVDAEKIQNETIRMLSTPVGELDAVRRQKEDAIESGDFERAAVLRDRERQMASVQHEDWPEPDTSYASVTLGGGGMFPLGRFQLWVFSWGPLVLALAVGVLIGWLIWG